MGNLCIDLYLCWTISAISCGSTNRWQQDKFNDRQLKCKNVNTTTVIMYIFCSNMEIVLQMCDIYNTNGEDENNYDMCRQGYRYSLSSYNEKKIHVHNSHLYVCVPVILLRKKNQGDHNTNVLNWFACTSEWTLYNSESDWWNQKLRTYELTVCINLLINIYDFACIKIVEQHLVVCTVKVFFSTFGMILNA